MYRMYAECEVMNLLFVMSWFSVLTRIHEKMKIQHITLIVFYKGS